MVRVFTKGGVWKNSEDEILKVAVMKYGKQNWARCASLLNRKSAKQCKARWFEWLDPSVKKVEWSRDEEEKLLHLAKLMPAQWRSIAPVVGRTATQCQAKYEDLLDRAARKADPEGAGDVDGAGSSSRELRAGEIDVQPETKPARPDPIDMDEDEVEMLQEARARLANTQGKKAKRKGREKMLAEAKRLADLQKRRELKAAGIISSGAKRKVKRGEIDYGVEIPFHKPAPRGFNDTTSEVEASEKIRMDRLKQIDFGKINEQNMRTRDAEAKEQRKKDQQRIKALEKANMELAVAHVSKVNDPGTFRPRGSLSLPAPSVSDAELAAMKKSTDTLAMPPPKSVNPATDALMADYNDRPLPTPLRTPAADATPRSDIIMQEAANLRNLSSGQTPLLGGENPELLSATPKPTNLVADGRETPVVNRKRDAFGLNATPGFSETSSYASYSSYVSGVRSVAREERRAAKRARIELQAALATLPEPQYEYELAAPDDTESDAVNEPSPMELEEDAADIKAREAEIKRLEAEVEAASRTTVVKRGDLPRVPSNFAQPKVEGEVEEEAVRLMKHDAWKHPVEMIETGGGKKKKKGSQTAAAIEPAPIDVIPLAELDAARALLDGETGQAKGDEWRLGQEGATEMLWLGAGTGWKIGGIKEADRLKALHIEHADLVKARELLTKKADKLEAKLKVKFGGYAMKASETLKKMVEIDRERSDVSTDEAVFGRLKAMEEMACSGRMDKLKREVEDVMEVSKTMQARYAELQEVLMTS